MALIRQLGRSPKPLAMAAGVAAVLALLPGLPMLPFMALAGLAGGGAWIRYKHPPVAVSDEPLLPAVTEQPISDTLKMDMIRLELGYGLLTLAGGEAPRLTEQIKGLPRRELEMCRFLRVLTIKVSNLRRFVSRHSPLSSVGLRCNPPLSGALVP